MNKKLKTMKNETTYHIGDYQHTQTAKTTATAPTIGRVCPLDAKTKGCGRSTKRQTPVRTDKDVTNGILKCTFLPKLKETQTVQAHQKPNKTEKDFYQSLSQLSEYYGIEPMQTKEYGYPYNVVLAMWDMETQLRRMNVNWDNFRLIQDSEKNYLVSEERYDTSMTLFYVPVIPLFQMLKDPKRKKTAQLLVSVCCYLYHIADIPYYRQENTYLYWQYEMIDRKSVV